MTIRTLSVELTTEEIAAYSNELATITSMEAEVEAEKKEKMSDFTAKLNKCAADRRMLARKITTRKEDRQVECDWEFDYPKGKAYLIRLDTGVTIDSRPLTDDERQQRLDLEGEENPYPDHESTHHQQGPVIDGEILQIEHKPELAEEQWRDSTCDEWRTCDYADECFEQFGQDNHSEENPVCFKSEASKHQPEAAEENQED